jgi:hypothetical protein
MNTDTDRIVTLALDLVFDCCERADWSAYDLPRPLFVAWAVTTAQETINNGSLAYFFENDWPDNPSYSIFVEAFREIGADVTTGLLEEAVNEFPFENPHLDFEKRRAHLEECGAYELDGDSKMDQLGCKIMDLNDENYVRLAEYILRHKAHFPHLEEKRKT